MTAILDIAIPLFAGLSIALAMLFAYRGFQSRARSSRAAFGVAQQESRQTMRIEFVRGLTAAFVGLILFGVVGLSARPAVEESTPAPLPASSTPAAGAATTVPSTESPSPTATEVSAEPATPAPSTAQPTATTPLVTDTPTPLPVATDTPTAEPVTATVISEVGVWLRAIPGTEGEQLEWVLEGTTLTLLPGLETADDLEWQQVRTPAGNEGWVAVPFIQYNQ